MKIQKLILQSRPLMASLSQYRGFVQSLVKSSIVVGGNPDDDFLPEFAEIEINHLRKLDSSISVKKKPDDMLKHGEEVGGVLYKYDLPIENVPIALKSSLMVKEEIPLTATESLFE